MKLKTILSALAIAAIPMTAQAGQASALTMQLHEPLSTSSQAISQGNEAYSPVVGVSGAIENNGDSTAMAKARATLNAKNHQVSVKEVAGDSLKPARDATT